MLPRFRIAVINDFKNTFAFVDYQEFGTLKVWDFSWSKGEPRSYQKADDCYCVFFNYQKVYQGIVKEEALSHIQRLIENPPKDMDFGVLFSAL